MRLLNTSTIELAEFFDKNIPPYAILSHTWGEEEVTFKDMRKETGKSKAGYQKIQYICAQAKSDGYEWAWCDTCCIDKKSSAELSEAINSMFRWYQNASVAYVYLADVQKGDQEAWHDAFNHSRWHTRGWTLQELLAPRKLIFYSAEWQKLGTRMSLSECIAKATGIHIAAIISTSDGSIGGFSIAQRMPWASKRQTTRIEDTAYSLMGIFGINMPLLYGKGDKAFIRLQEEIMKKSDDQSLFAWRCSDFSSDEGRGLLATGPEDFADSASIVGFTMKAWTLGYDYGVNFKHVETAHTATSRGIELALQFQPCECTGFFVALLACRSLPSSVLVSKAWKGSYKDLLNGIAICLRKHENLYTRVNTAYLFSLPPNTSMRHVLDMLRRAGKRDRSQYDSWVLAPQRICVTRTNTDPFGFDCRLHGPWVSQLIVVTVDIVHFAGYHIYDIWPRKRTSSVLFALNTEHPAVIVFRRSGKNRTHLDLRPCNYVYLYLANDLSSLPRCRLSGHRVKWIVKRSDTLAQDAEDDFWSRRDEYQPTSRLDLGSTSPGRMIAEISPIFPEHRDVRVYNLVVRTENTK